MKIGILIREFNQLENWELKIFDEIQKDPSLEIALLIKDGRTQSENPNTRPKRFIRFLKSGNVSGKLLFKIITIIESKLFYKHKQTVNRNDVIQRLSKIPVIELKPTRKGFLDIFTKEDAEKVGQYNLDIILRHQFHIIRGDILTAAKYGIWSFHHADNSINRGSPAGFWEIVNKNPLVGVTLQQLTPELDGGLVIDKAFYSCFWSHIKNNQLILEKSYSLLMKNIKKLQQGKYEPVKSKVYYNRLYKSPGLFTALKYAAGFYYNLLKRACMAITARLGVRYDCWTLFIGSGNFYESVLYRLSPSEPPANSFWADPFLFNYKGEDYVFFEDYSYKTGKAKISCGKVVNNKVTEVREALKLSCHVSFPFIFEEDGQIYMMPETGGNKRLEIYRCVEFPGKWELYSTAFEGELLTDAVYYKDDNGARWLFLSKAVGIEDDLCSELEIYQIDSLKLNKITPHKLNPVIIDASRARNAGAFFNYDSMLIRPSQNNSRGKYGYALNLNRVDILTLEDYRETPLVTVEPNFKKGLSGIHHMHQISGKFVCDAAYKYKM